MNQGAITFQKVHESAVWQASISMSYQRIFSSLKKRGQKTLAVWQKAKRQSLEMCPSNNCCGKVAQLLDNLVSQCPY